MKIALEVKNTSRAIKPMTNDVIIFDGKIWYITSKDEILKEANKTLEECKEQLENSKKEYALFKKEVATQLLEMSELIKSLYSNKEK